MRVIVTRPEREAQRWVLDLVALGWDAVALPLIQVGPVTDCASLLQVWQHLDEYVGVMFVSGNAADYFFKQNQPLAPVFTAQAAMKMRATRAWATGPGTAKALLRAGVAPELLDAPPLDAGQFDSEALWQVVSSQVQPGSRVLIVRGGDSAGAASQGSGREWFAHQVAQAGGKADFVLAYQRCAPAFSEDERQLAQQAATAGAVWLFSSTEAVTNLCAALPGQSWAEARALATHPRIALAARNAGFGVVGQSRPTLPDVVVALGATL